MIWSLGLPCLTVPRVRTQLNIQVSADFLVRIRAAAEAQGRTVTSLALQWLEAGLAGASPSDDGAAVIARLDSLEARLSRLEAAELPSPPPPPRPPSLSVRVAPAPSLETPELFSLEEKGSERLTTAELADRTQTNRAAWNNWANQNDVGSVRHHPAAGPWRLVGQQHEPRRGGPLRYLWERA
jgi:hypothetical protein